MTPGPCGPASAWSRARRPRRRRPRRRPPRHRVAGSEALAQRRRGGRERVDHRLVAGLGGAEVDDRGQRRVERGGEPLAVEPLGVAEAASRRRGRPSPTAGRWPADGRHQGLAGEHEQPAGRACRALGGERLADRLEPAGHVDPVVAVADRGVELREVVGTAGHRGLGLVQPGDDGTVTHSGRHRAHAPQRSAAVWTEHPTTARARRRAPAASGTRRPSRAT